MVPYCGGTVPPSTHDLGWWAAFYNRAQGWDREAAPDEPVVLNPLRWGVPAQLKNLKELQLTPEDEEAGTPEEAEKQMRQQMAAPAATRTGKRQRGRMKVEVQPKRLVTAA